MKPAIEVQQMCQRQTSRKAKKILGFLGALISLVSCSAEAPGRPAFRPALDAHVAAIQKRDLDAFERSLTRGETLYTIFPDGGAIVTRDEAVSLHAEWFNDLNWRWDGEVVRVVEGADTALALMRYAYRDTPEGAPRSTWLALVFKLEDGEWRLVHDQNTRIQPAAEG